MHFQNVTKIQTKFMTQIQLQIQNAAVQWLCVGHDPGVTRQGCSLAQGWRGQGSLLQTQKYTNT